ncbi:MAG: tetratricopeptide repeat protein [Flavipsychrobacter sp.]
MRVTLRVTITLLTTLGIYSFPSLAQSTSDIDSLKTELNKSSITEKKADVANRIAFILKDKELDTAITYAELAYTYAIQASYDLGQADALLNQSMIYANAGMYDEALSNGHDAIDLYKLKLVRAGSKEQKRIKKGLGDSYNNIGVTYFYQGQYDSVEQNFLKSLEYRTEVDDKPGIAFCYGNLGALGQVQSNYPKALKYQLRALEIQKEQKYDWGIAAAYNNIGIVYLKQGKLAEALNMHLSALKIRKKIDDKRGVASSYNNIGNILIDQERFQEGLDNYQKALAIAIQLNDKRSEADCYDNVGIAYQKLGKYDLELESHLTALKIRQKIGDAKGIADSYHNIGSTYLEQKDYDNALKYYAVAIEQHKKLDDKFGLAYSYYNAGRIYLNQKNTQKASVYLKKGLELSNETGHLESIKDSYLGLYLLDSTLGDFVGALKYYKQYVVAKDSLYSADVARKTVQAQMEYEFEIKEELIKSENDKKNALTKAANKARIRVILAVSCSLLVITILVFYFIRKRQKDKYNLELADVKQSAIKAQLDSHFISVTLLAINEFIENRDKQSAQDYLNKFSRLIRNVLRNSTVTQTTLKEELNFVDDYFQLASLSFPENKISCQVHISEEINPEIVVMPPMVLQIVVENALRHGLSEKKEGTVTIDISKDKDKIKCVVEDTGVGVNAKKQGKHIIRKSYGTSLAERLVSIWNHNNKKAYFQIMDKSTEISGETGTRVIFSFPIIEI